MSDLTTEVIGVSPTLAAEWLRTVRNKAKIDTRTVLAYAHDMERGLWKLNGEPIILSSQGELLSGRLRLHACMKAATSFPTLVIRGIDDANFETIDAVRRRTFADVLTIRREPFGRTLAAALIILWRYGNDSLTGKAKKVSGQTLIAILDANPEIRTSLRLTKDVTPTLPHGVATALHYLFSRINADLSDRFFQEVVESTQRDGHAPFILRRQLDESFRQGGKRTQSMMIALTIKAWEAFRSGRPIGVLRYSPQQNEAFPKISDLPDEMRFDGISRSVMPTKEGEIRPSALSIALKVNVENITPQRAERILEQNDGNRSIASAVVDKYARDIKAGAWVLNGQTIKIGQTGRLLDGQHRCAAAIKAGRAFDAIVVEGLDESVFDTFDLGARRSLGEILQDRNEINTSTLAAVLRQAWLFENGFMQYRTISPTVAELLDFLQHHSEIRESVRLAHKVRDIVAPAIACALHFFFAQVHKSKADEFVARLGDGVNLGEFSPIRRLRERLNKDRGSRKREMSDAEKAAIIIKAWNALRLGQHLRALKWQNAGPKKEEFPLIDGLQLGERTEAA
jgi:hypothetical protein